jgi:hypothetical protein
MNAWDHLPNASHIDWVLASVKQHPEIWDATWGAARHAVYDAVYDATYIPAMCHAAQYAARRAAWNATYVAVAAYAAARSATLALIAYDDCAHLLEMSSEQLKTWAVLSEQPAAMLLLPAVIAREQIRELEQA